MKGPLSLLLDHVESCDACCWVTRSFCKTADILLEIGAKKAAEGMVPIPTIPRSKVKA